MHIWNTAPTRDEDEFHRTKKTYKVLIGLRDSQRDAAAIKNCLGIYPENCTPINGVVKVRSLFVAKESFLKRTLIPMTREMLSHDRNITVKWNSERRKIDISSQLSPDERRAEHEVLFRPCSNREQMYDVHQVEISQLAVFDAGRIDFLQDLIQQSVRVGQYKPGEQPRSIVITASTLSNSSWLGGFVKEKPDDVEILKVK